MTTSQKLSGRHQGASQIFLAVATWASWSADIVRFRGVVNPQRTRMSALQKTAMRPRHHFIWLLVVYVLLGLSSTGLLGQVEFRQVYSFGFPETSGASPDSELVESDDGFFYGTTASDGRFNGGLVFRVRPDGTGHSVVHHFNPWDAKGHSPGRLLVEGRDHRLYGITSLGGTNHQGTVFRVGRDGSGFQALHLFGSQPGDGASPAFGVLEASDGFLYGVTTRGGAAGAGTVFKLSADGAFYQVLRSFAGSGAEGRSPATALVEASNGFLYGTTQSGGAGGAGTVFRIQKDGAAFEVLRSFDKGLKDPENPSSRLVEGGDGFLYGASENGGQDGAGTVYRLRLDGTAFHVLHSFNSSLDGLRPTGLILARDGLLYGTTCCAESGNIFRLATDGTRFSVVHAFDYIGGSQPFAGVIQGRDGALYGTTCCGGSGGSFGGDGTIFRVNGDGSDFSVLRVFRRGGGDGSSPGSELSFGPDGLAYGVTFEGGWFGGGTLFRINRSGAGCKVLWDFERGPDSGAHPLSSVVVAGNGVIFGTTGAGGLYRAGTIFRFDPRARLPYRTLYSFGEGMSGLPPLPYYDRMIVLGSDGLLYGMADTGGEFGDGMIFRLGKDGSGFSILHSFGSSGAFGGPMPSDMIEGRDGQLYGTLLDGMGGAGVIFRIRKDSGAYTAIYRFGERITGAGPEPVKLLHGQDGKLYGTTWSGGGLEGSGTVFSLNTDGTGFRVLKAFKRNEDGGGPKGRLAQDSSGILYGVTTYGGLYESGTLFKLQPNGNGFATLWHLGTPVADGDFSAPGRRAEAGLLWTGAGLLGVTREGGTMDNGTIFELRFPVLDISRLPNQQTKISFGTLTNHSYSVEFKRAIADPTWQTLASFAGDGSGKEIIEPGTSSQSFYRLRVKSGPVEMPGPNSLAGRSVTFINTTGPFAGSQYTLAFADSQFAAVAPKVPLDGAYEYTPSSTGASLVLSYTQPAGDRDMMDLTFYQANAGTFSGIVFTENREQPFSGTFRIGP